MNEAEREFEYWHDDMTVDEMLTAIVGAAHDHQDAETEDDPGRYGPWRVTQYVRAIRAILATQSTPLSQPVNDAFCAIGWGERDV